MLETVDLIELFQFVLCYDTCIIIAILRILHVKLRFLLLAAFVPLLDIARLRPLLRLQFHLGMYYWLRFTTHCHLQPLFAWSGVVNHFVETVCLHGGIHVYREVPCVFEVVHWHEHLHVAVHRGDRAPFSCDRWFRSLQFASAHVCIARMGQRLYRIHCWPFLNWLWHQIALKNWIWYHGLRVCVVIPGKWVKLLDACGATYKGKCSLRNWMGTEGIGLLVLHREWVLVILQLFLPHLSGWGTSSHSIIVQITKQTRRYSLQLPEYESTYLPTVSYMDCGNDPWFDYRILSKHLSKSKFNQFYLL